MDIESSNAADALTRSFLRDYPRDAAREIEALPTHAVAQAIAGQPVAVLGVVWDYLLPDIAEALFLALPEATAVALLAAMDPGRAAAVLGRLDEGARARYLGRLDEPVAGEIERYLEYPADSAARLMDVRVTALRGETTAGQALDHLRRTRRPGRVRHVFLVDEIGRLESEVDLQALALADSDVPLHELARPVAAAVAAVESHEDVADRLERFRVEELPVVDADGRLLGVIRSEVLLRTVQDAAGADLQAMVGVSRDEHALSSVGSAVRKRLLWMEINLLTAFLAAAVVGLFESTIAQFTALAVLLPVVAGQSGNAGAQALAVTIRGLALHEVGIGQWLRLLLKEARVGVINGVVVSLTTAAGVYVWSRSTGLALVIGLAMVLSMSIACVAGAMVPLVLTRLGQDPAQSSSIILTTVTDIAGFMSFLGIATLLAALLVAG